MLNSGQDIQYINGKIVDVPQIETADGSPPIINGSVSRDPNIIDETGVTLDLEIGNNTLADILANDTGGGVTGYRPDLYEGIGKAKCLNYPNTMAVGACSSVTQTCPALAVQ